MSVLAIERWSRAAHQLSVTYRLDDLAFTTSMWWSDVDLLELEARHGRALMEQLYFHIAAFEAALALRPDDAAARRALDRCRAYLAEPPPPDWSGVFQATEK